MTTITAAAVLAAACLIASCGESCSDRYAGGILPGGAVIRKSASSVIFTFNDWSDIMPLAVEHNISHISSDGGGTWWAEYATEINQQFIMCSKQSYQSESPQRAIACCLILVLQEREA